MSKIGQNSSLCWRTLMCTTTHYLTQPFPNPVSHFMHNLPVTVHKAEVVVNHIVELVLPFALLLPFRKVRIVAAIVSIGYMLCLMITGNYAFIQTITLVPLIMCLDDKLFNRQESKSSSSFVEKVLFGVVVVFAGVILFNSSAPIKLCI
jgi:hypothetical protein